MAQSITIPESDWRPACPDGGEDESLALLATLTINGTDFHVGAYAVQLDESGTQVALRYDDTVAAVFAAVGGDGAWEATTIAGREYVLIITPYCA